MRRWFEVLRAPDNDGPSGGDTHRVDMGAPVEVGVDHEPPDESTAPKKSTAEIELENLKADNERLKRRADESEEDARYWANRNRRAASDSVEQPRTVAQPAAAAAVPAEMTAEELVEGLNKEGVQTLYKAGFINQVEMQRRLDALKEELTGFVKGERADAEFGGRIAAEFPTIAQESAKINRAKVQGSRYAPTDPLFLRAGELYREAIADDPSLEGSQGIILATARMAQRELTAEGKGTRTAPSGDRRPAARTEESPARRRDRIERQRPDRGREDDEQVAGNDQFDENQLAVMKHLNVKPEKFVAHRDAAVKQESRRGRR